MNSPSPPASREESVHDWSEERDSHSPQEPRDSPVPRPADGQDFLRDRDGSPKRQYNGPRSDSPEGVHPGESVFNFPEGGPVRLTGLTPISPTNEEVFGPGVNSYTQNPQPTISILSPRQNVGYPFLFSTSHTPIFSIAESEKYRKLMQKKARRDNKKEKNVKQVMKAEEVAGYKGNENIDEVLQSLGENPGNQAEGKKGKKTKIEKTKPDKKGRRSVEKTMEDDEKTPLLMEDEDEDEEEERPVKVRQERKFQDPVVSELNNFSKNFYLVNPEPGDLRKHKSTENLGKSSESLNSVSFTKVIKKQRGKKGKEEPGRPPPPPDKTDNNRRTTYALRSRDVNMSSSAQPPANNRSGESGVSSPSSSVGSSSHIQPIDPAPPTTVYNLRHPIPVVSVRENKVVGHEIKITKDLDFSADFPALPGGEESDQIVAGGAWSRPIVRHLEKKNTETSELTVYINGDNDNDDHDDNKDDNDDDAIAETSDNTAVINNQPVPLVEQDDNENGDNIEDASEVAVEVKEDSSEGVTEASEDLTKTDIYADLSVHQQNEEHPLDNQANLADNNDQAVDDYVADYVADEAEIVVENIDPAAAVVVDPVEVVLDEDEFDRATSSRHPPVMILGQNAEDWQSSEFTFGFDVNEELLARSLRGDLTPVPDHYSPLQAPLTPIDTVDAAILSFGDPDPTGTRTQPLLVGVPVAVPVSSMSHYTAYPGFAAPAVTLPAPFPHYIAAPYVVPITPSSTQHYAPGDHDQKTQNDELAEVQTVSPESGISSASPLSWQPDSSPSLGPAPCSPGHAPGSYPRHAPRSSGSILHHVNESLENWSGPDSSECSGSSRDSPVSVSACPHDNNNEDNDVTQESQEMTQMTDVTKTGGGGSSKVTPPSWASQVDMSLGEPTGEEEDDMSENTLGKMSSRQDDKFNYDQIVKYISESWTSVSKEVKTKPQKVRYYEKSNSVVVEA